MGTLCRVLIAAQAGSVPPPPLFMFWIDGPSRSPGWSSAYWIASTSGADGLISNVFLNGDNNGIFATFKRDKRHLGIGDRNTANGLSSGKTQMISSNRRKRLPDGANDNPKRSNNGSRRFISQSQDQ
ncbi:hypothetical protein EVAR_13416_1 [Eumeta japonica]|uniref:Uncharacterized protein n=1 Tax=Eumeta variegata TaxID=151549 RepID=A0A4C1V7H8_EUMVA|nr:hypothetical protein EVAR_13416_1 [Eumeta japonica]